ncbi:High-affnity carbon uptake protein Hat/HatR [Minicystis rosea]|nr:High-affnity carbon uptake protein Hat/HatR [Minicystis rosea]
MSIDPEKTRLDPEHPYPGPSSFDEEHAAFFHGRAREADELFALVELRPLTVLYGKSGLGKTSLLQAGLFPRMRRAGLVPLRFRLLFGVDEVGKRQPPLPEQVRQRLREATQRGEIDGAPPREGETLWEYFHWTGFWDEAGRPVTPVLVLDQFEEVFTLGRDRADELRALMRELSDLVENRIPAALRDAAVQGNARLPPSFETAGAKVLIALREDFLAQLDDHRPQMPSLSASRYRLRPLGGLAARDAVLEPGRAVVTEDVAARIVRKVVNAPDDAALDGIEEIEPALLALYCHELNALRVRSRAPKIEASLLAASETEILEQFYERCLRGMPDPVRLLVEESLLTPDNRRDTIALGRVGHEGVAEANVRKLVDRRLLRKEPRLGHEYVEIVHDKLIPTIAKKRDVRQRKEREAAAQREREAQDAAERTREAEERAQREEALREEAEKEKQRAEAESLRAEAEKARADAEKVRAEEVEQRRVLAEKLAASRSRRNLMLVVLAAVLALAAIGIPWWQIWSAKQAALREKRSADRARIEEDKKRAAELSDLAFRAAADQRWDDVARMLASAYRAIEHARALYTAMTPVKSGAPPEGMPAAPPLLALLASRFEAMAGQSRTLSDDPSGIDSFVLTRDGRTGAELGADGRTVTLIDLAGTRAPIEAQPPGVASTVEKELDPAAAELTDTFSGAIRALVPSGDGSLLFGQSDRGQVVVWRTSDGQRRLGFRTGLFRARLAVDLAGRRVVLWDRAASRAVTLAIDAEAGRIGDAVELPIQRAKGKAPAGAGAWTNDSGWFAIAPTADGARVVGIWDDAWLRDGNARERKVRTDLELWDASNGQRVAQASFPARVRATSLSVRGELLAALSDDGEVRVFGLAGDGIEPKAVLPQRDPKAEWIAFQDPKPELLTPTESAVSLWDLATPESPKQRFELALGGAPRQAVVAPDGREALVWVDDEVRVYDLALGQPHAAATVPETDRRASSAVQLRANEDARWMVTARDDALRARSLGGVAARGLDRYVWGAAAEAKATFSTLLPRAGRVEDVVDDGDHLAVLAEGTVFIVGPDGPDRLAVRAIRQRDPTLLRAVRLRAGHIAALDGRGGVRFGDARVTTLQRTNDENRSSLLALAEGGAWAASAGAGPKVSVWDADSGQFAWTGDVRQKSSGAPFAGEAVAITALGVTTDDATHPRAIVGDARGGVRAMRTGGKGKHVAWSTVDFDPSPHHGEVRAVEIGPGGRIATGADDGTMALWEKDGRIVRTLNPSTAAAVRALRFADEGRLLVSGDAGGEAHVWRTSDGGGVCTVKHGDEITDLAVERGANARAASVDKSGAAIVWNVATCEPIRSLRGMAYVGFASGARDRVIGVRRTGRVELWPTTGAGSELPRDRPRGTAAWGVFLDAGTLATGDEEGSLFSWKLDAGAAPTRLSGELGGIPSVASAAGHALTITPEGHLRAWPATPSTTASRAAWRSSSATPCARPRSRAMGAPSSRSKKAPTPRCGRAPSLGSVGTRPRPPSRSAAACAATPRRARPAARSRPAPPIAACAPSSSTAPAARASGTTAASCSSKTSAPRAAPPTPPAASPPRRWAAPASGSSSRAPTARSRSGTSAPTASAASPSNAAATPDACAPSPSTPTAAS